MATARVTYQTKARERIAGVLQAEPRFLTAAEIHRRLQERADGPAVALSTVYRTLEHLLTRGQVTVRTDDAGEASYMVCEPSHHHHHAICGVCGRVENVDCTAVDEFAKSLRASNGFELSGHAMEFFGTCRQCK